MVVWSKLCLDYESNYIATLLELKYLCLLFINEPYHIHMFMSKAKYKYIVNALSQRSPPHDDGQRMLTKMAVDFRAPLSFFIFFNFFCILTCLLFLLCVLSFSCTTTLQCLSQLRFWRRSALKAQLSLMSDEIAKLKELIQRHSDSGKVLPSEGGAHCVEFLSKKYDDLHLFSGMAKDELQRLSEIGRASCRERV